MYLWKEGLIKFSTLSRFLPMFPIFVELFIFTKSAISWLCLLCPPIVNGVELSSTMTPTEQVIIFYHPFKKIMTEMV